MIRDWIHGILELREAYSSALQHAHEAGAVPNAQGLDLHSEDAMGSQGGGGSLQFGRRLLECSELTHGSPLVVRRVTPVAVVPVRTQGCRGHNAQHRRDGEAFRRAPQRGAKSRYRRRKLGENPAAGLLAKNDRGAHRLGDKSIVVVHPFHAQNCICSHGLGLCRQAAHGLTEGLRLGLGGILPGEPPDRPCSDATDEAFDLGHLQRSWRRLEGGGWQAAWNHLHRIHASLRGQANGRATEHTHRLKWLLRLHAEHCVGAERGSGLEEALSRLLEGSGLAVGQVGHSQAPVRIGADPLNNSEGLFHSGAVRRLAHSRGE
mmetsp:Transcript_62686/g.149600  ORF Transcript_62686/g.149600 Transcript_62686/m.149600 type:complete len:319 (-) Transcript_62686:872-1828(-)